MSHRFILKLTLVVLLSCASASGQLVTGEQRVVQPIIVNGQHTQGVLVIENGTVRSHTCSAPQPFVAENRSESGWACFDDATATWLLHALPPSQALPPQQAVILQTRPGSVYVVPSQPVYYSYYPATYYDPYPYYYPYAYSYPIIRPGFGFGFGYRSPVFFSRPIFVERLIAPVGRIGPIVRTAPAFGRVSGPRTVVGRVGTRRR